MDIKKIFSSLLAGYLGVLICWVIFGTTGYFINLLFSHTLVIVLNYFITVFIMLMYFRLFVRNLSLAGILALSVLLLIFVIPYLTVKFMSTLNISVDRTYYGIILSTVVMGFIWSIILLKAEKESSMN